MWPGDGTARAVRPRGDAVVRHARIPGARCRVQSPPGHGAAVDAAGHAGRSRAAALGGTSLGALARSHLCRQGCRRRLGVPARAAVSLADRRERTRHAARRGVHTARRARSTELRALLVARARGGLRPGDAVGRAHHVVGSTISSSAPPDFRIASARTCNRASPKRSPRSVARLRLPSVAGLWPANHGGQRQAPPRQLHRSTKP